MILRNFFKFLAIFLFFFTQILQAKEFARCDRSKAYQQLSPALIKKLQQGEIVQITEVQAESGYWMNYTISLSSWDTELVMAVFSAYEEQEQYIRGVLKSVVEKHDKNWAQVRYEIDSGYMVIPNIFYVVLDQLSKDQSTYYMNWSLVSSSGKSRPEYIDGFLKAESLGKGSVLIHCNYMIPESKWWKDTVNTDNARRAIELIKDLTQRVESIGSAVGKANQYRERIRALF